MASVVIYSRIMFSILWLYDWICFVHNTKLKTLGITKNDGKKNLLRTDCWLVRNACNYLLWQKWKHSYSELVESLSGSQGTVDYPIIHFAGCRQVHLESHLAIIEASYIDREMHSCCYGVGKSESPVHSRLKCLYIYEETHRNLGKTCQLKEHTV